MQAYNQAINDLDRELDYLKNQVEVYHIFLLKILLRVKTFLVLCRIVFLNPNAPIR